MQPTRLIYEALSDLLAADPATLASVAAMHVHLIKANFVPALGLAWDPTKEADFTGATAIDAGTGTQGVFYDPATNLRVIELKEPAGGWQWICTADPTPAQTIYGFQVTDNTDTDLYGAELFNTPITISAAGQGLDIPYIRFRFLLTSPN